MKIQNFPVAVEGRELPSLELARARPSSHLEGRLPVPVLWDAWKLQDACTRRRHWAATAVHLLARRRCVLSVVE